MIKVVFEFPPNESVNILVNFEFLYGICYAFESVSEFMTFPKQDKDWLIRFPSSKVTPERPDLVTLSEPAKSIINNLDL